MKKLLILLAAAMLVMGFAGYASAGEYYMYANFNSSDGFLGGYDVDSYGDYLYVNRNGNTIDRYTVSTATDATTDANTHLLNIGPDGLPGTADDNVGTMAVRTLTYDTSYSVPAIGSASVSEIYADAGGLYFLDEQSDVSYYDFSTTATTKITAASSTNLSQLARSADDTWYASNEQNDIFRYDSGVWTKIIDHILSPGGGHLDGLEIVSLDVTDDGVDNAEEWIFAADMTSDYMKRYALDGTYAETYTYNDPTTMYLEGMGFGANNHFWATGPGTLYEIGGGVFENIEPTTPVPEPSTILLLGIGLAGLVGYSRKKKLFRNK